MFAAAVLLLALVGSVAAQVDVPVPATVSQSVTISSVGSISGWVITPGTTGTNAAVTIHRVQNVPTRLTVLEAVHASKPVAALGYMQKYNTTTGTYYLDTAMHLAAPLQIKAGSGSLMNVPTTAQTLLAAGSVGTLDDVLTFSQPVSMSDPAVTGDQQYRAVVTIDAVV